MSGSSKTAFHKIIRYTDNDIEMNYGVEEFRSELDNIFNVKELEFDLPPAFGKYRIFFPKDAVAHPAKFYVDVIEYLIKRYTKVGDMILDPMCGTGIGCVVAALHGRNCIGVDIEEKFIRWCIEAKQRVEKHKSLLPKGSLIFIRGDARKLTAVLHKHLGKLSYGAVDIILTSPPYSEAISKRAGGRRSKIANVGISTITARAYSYDDNNIGNLPHQLYLEAMLRVYTECFKVLKPSGKIIIIIKPFIKNKEVVDLPYRTYSLLENVGFKTVEVLKYRLKRRSFWRILYEKKFPHVPKIRHEYVIIAEKGMRN